MRRAIQVLVASQEFQVTQAYRGFPAYRDLVASQAFLARVGFQERAAFQERVAFQERLDSAVHPVFQAYQASVAPRGSQESQALVAYLDLAAFRASAE